MQTVWEQEVSRHWYNSTKPTNTYASMPFSCLGGASFFFIEEQEQFVEIFNVQFWSFLKILIFQKSYINSLCFFATN